MSKIIALVGSKRAGKSTTFSYLKALDASLVEVALANKLKNVCSEVFDVPREWFDNEQKEVPLREAIILDFFHVSSILNRFDLPFLMVDGNHLGIMLTNPRRIAQYVGTEILRSFNEDIHCEHAIKSLPNNVTGVISDCRFFSEFNYFKNNYNNFTAIYIDNKKAEEIAKGDSHPSEKYVLEIAKECHYTIDNNGTLDNLKDRVTDLFYGKLKE